LIIEYKALDNATRLLTVNSGTGGGSYKAGTVVTISATSGSGLVFDQWTGNTANVANINLPNTTITMPSYAAEVTATYKALDNATRLLTVNSGTGGGYYKAGIVVTISANTSGAGIVFDKWTGNTANIANINLPNTTITMPPCAAEVTATYKDQGSDLPLLTVTSGTGTGNYLPGTVVTISANTSGAAVVFDKWIGDTAYIANINLTNTTFVMPSHAATVTATYKNRGGATFTLTVTSGTGAGHYLPGTVVDIAANKASAGYVFDKWVGNTANVENINLPNTIIQMPFADSTVIASYKAQVITKYTLTVTSGTGGADYLPGATINISADAPAAGKMFDQWTGDTSNITNINLPDTIIVMPSRSTAITATYKNQGTSYGLTVNYGTGGSGAAGYLPGTVVSISANISGAGIVFDKWTGDSTYIANINMPNTAFVMPSHAAVVTATYIDQGVGTFTLTVTDGTGGNTVTGYLPGTVVDIAANKPPAGKVFDGWIGNTANIENINLPNTTIVMPFSNTEIMATYIDQGSEYTLTVTNGTGGGSYLPGKVVAISSNTSGSGVVFDKWIGDTANIANIFLPNTTIYTPFYAATVVAIYKNKESPIVNYPLTVTRGSGGGSYPPGTCVSIMADTATSGAGLIFDKWTGQTARVTNIHQSETTLLMPFSAATVIATYTTQGAISYILTVNSGKGYGTYLPGSVVNIEADVAPAGQVFDKWIGQTDHIGNIYLPCTVIVMPLANTEITATYRDQEDETYALTVTNGDGDGVYLPGTVVNISANTSGAGIVFDKWVGQTTNVANINLPNTSIRIPFSPVTVIATYTTPGAITYTLTVTNGEGGGNTYPSGSEVNIAANAAPAGYVFDKWVGQTAHIANINLPNTTIQMPFADTAVTATYKISRIQTYTLTVTDGTGGGVYLPGTVINIVANAAPSGYVFEKWIEQTNHVANINLSSTTIIMPFSETTAIATYRAQGETKRDLYVYNGTGTGIYLPGTVVTISAHTSGAGIVFDKWVGQTSHIANINLPNTTLNMPFSGGPTDSFTSLLNTIINILSLDSASTSTTVEATYKDPGETTYKLTVTNGTGGGSYKAGTVVNISANTPAAGSIFNKWIGQSEPLENINNATTTVYMPSNDMAVQATYNNLVTATANAGGTVSPASQSVANGNTTQFTATPIVSYCNRLDTVNGNCPAGTWSGNTYTTGIITTGCLVTFNFECAYPPPPPDPLPPTLLVDPSGRAVDREAGTTTFTVNNGGNGALNWSAAVTSQSSWLSITSGASGVNSGTIVISYTANTSNESRTAAIRVTADGAKGSPKDVTITQAGRGTPVLTVAPANRDVAKDAGSTTFAVSNTGTGDMKWVSQVTSGSTWLEITSGIAGTNSGTIACRFTANTGATSRAGSIRVIATDATGSPRNIAGSPRNITITQSVYSGIVSNAIGPLNFIKISDLSGNLPTDGGSINVRAWNANGAELTSTVNVSALKLFNHGTTMIAGSNLAQIFSGGAPLLYEFSIDSAQLVITNVKDSTDGLVRVPISYARGMKNYVSNFTGIRNFIKISDMTGALPADGATISIFAWDAEGHALPESVNTAPIKLYNHGTTVTEGTDIAARFSTGTPMTYLFNVESNKYLFTNVKRSVGNWLHVPVSQPFGLSNYVTNFAGPYNILYISDMSGMLPTEGAAITVKAWDTDGHAIAESGGAPPLLLNNHGTTTIGCPELIARFSAGAPMTYEFMVDSTKVLIQDTKSSYTDGMVKAPVFYTKGISNFVMNHVSTLHTFKISDMSGALSASGGAISIKSWDVDGNALVESGGAAPLYLYNHATTILEGAAIAARFSGGTPVIYEFFIGSSRALVTVLTTIQDGTVKMPTVFTIGDCAGI
jgi:hypothetical protein